MMIGFPRCRQSQFAIKCGNSQILELLWFWRRPDSSLAKDVQGLMFPFLGWPIFLAIVVSETSRLTHR